MRSSPINRCAGSPPAGQPQIIRWRTPCLALAAVAVVMLATACSSIRLAYDNAPRLSWWWADGYVDFSSEQSVPVKAAIDDFYAWHRPTQLPLYAALMTELEAPLLQPTTGAAVCGWQDRIQRLLQPSIERALQATAERLPRLTEAEFEHIAERNVKKNAEFSKDHLHPDPEARAAAAFDRIADRAERVYGRLDDPQKALIRDQVAASQADVALSLAERQRRQRDTLETLRRLQAEAASPQRRLNALRGLSERSQSSPDPAYRQAQVEGRERNCAFMARLHNITTAGQRAKAQATAKGYAADLRALAAAAD